MLLEFEIVMVRVGKRKAKNKNNLCDVCVCGWYLKCELLWL